MSANVIIVVLGVELHALIKLSNFLPYPPRSQEAGEGGKRGRRMRLYRWHPISVTDGPPGDKLCSHLQIPEQGPIPPAWEFDVIVADQHVILCVAEKPFQPPIPSGAHPELRTERDDMGEIVLSPIQCPVFGIVVDRQYVGWDVLGLK